MADKRHIRVCAVGTEQDMTHLVHVLVQNAGALEDIPADEPPKTREELEAMVHQLAQWEGGREDGFLYETLTTIPFGTADIETASLTIRQESCGLWTAVFDYESPDGLQLEDWKKLHLRCNRLLMAAQYAAQDFGLEKGSVLLCGGRAMDNWETVNEGWLWLIERYECGYPPEEAVERLAALKRTMEAEDCGMTVTELLESCMDLLEDIASAVADPAALTARLREAVQQRDFQTLLSLQVQVAESVLWQTEHNHKWLANLKAVLEAWQASDQAD